MGNDVSNTELNESIKELTKAVRELTAALNNSQSGNPAKAEKTEADMCKAEDFVEQIYSGVYTIESMKKALIKRAILNNDGKINPFHPDCGLWMIKDGTIYGDPDAINNLILEMLAED